MAIARVFKSGNSQAVRLPKEFRFQVKEIEILRHGSDIILREPTRNLTSAYDALASIGDMGISIEVPDDPTDLFKSRKHSRTVMAPRTRNKAAR